MPRPFPCPPPQSSGCSAQRVAPLAHERPHVKLSSFPALDLHVLGRPFWWETKNSDFLSKGRAGGGFALIFLSRQLFLYPSRDFGEIPYQTCSCLVALNGCPIEEGPSGPSHAKAVYPNWSNCGGPCLVIGNVLCLLWIQ